MEIRIFDDSLERFIKSLRKKTYKQLKRELLEDKKIKQLYERLEPEFAVIEMIIKKRIEKGLGTKLKISLGK